MELINDLHSNDKRDATIATAITLVLIFVLLLFTHLDRNNPPLEPPVIYKEIPLEQIIDLTPIKDQSGGGGGGGGGNPTNDEVDPQPKPQTDHALTNTHGTTTAVNHGNSNKTTAENSDNKATSVKKSANPFGNGGDGEGEGGGVGKGKGLGFGNDNGDGNGPGHGPGDGGDGAGGRVRLKDPYVGDIYSDVNQIIRLKVKINEDGNVISAQNTSKTTSTDQDLIDKVKAATIAQAKYKKKPGAGVEEAFITIRINAR